MYPCKPIAMKRIPKTSIIFIIFFLCGIQVYAQEAFFEEEDEFLYPDFTVERLSDETAPDDVILPFIFNGYLYSFSLRNRTPLWRIFIGGDLRNPFSVRGDTLYFYDIYNRLYSIELEGGTLDWKTEIRSEIIGKPCIYKDLVIVSTQKGTIYLIDLDNGRVVYEYESRGEMSAHLNLFQNLLVASYKGGQIVAYNIDTGSTEWMFTAGGIINVTPVIKDGRVFFGAWDDTFYVLNALNGNLIWKSFVGENISRDFIVFQNKIILFFSKGQILGLNRYYGEIDWVKYFGNIEFNFNYFAGRDKFFIFVPELIAMDPEDGGTIFSYKDRAFYFYKEMLFENMIEGKHRLTDREKLELLSDVYFSVSTYPLLPPVTAKGGLSYFVADDAYLYVYGLEKDFFIVKYKLD
jgi:outer membrane protein assembly factor BamB